MISACDFPRHDQGDPSLAIQGDSRKQPTVNQLVEHLQGFGIDLFGGRFAPYQVIFRKLSEDTSEILAVREKQMPIRLGTLAETLAHILDQEHDRKLVIPSDEWPRPSQEPIQLPERFLYNALKLAAVLSFPAILADTVQSVYEREQKLPLFPSEVRVALLDALVANQREGELLQLWKEIENAGYSKNEYFITSPQTGKRGLLRGSLTHLKQAFAELAKNSVDAPEPEASRHARDVADAILWRCTSRNAPTSELKSATRTLFTDLAPRRTKEEYYQLIQLAGLANWPDWMRRQIPSLIRLGETRFLLKEEVSVCFLERMQLLPQGTRILDWRPVSKSNEAFHVVEIEAGGTGINELEKISNQYQTLTDRNLKSREALELDDIKLWLEDWQVYPTGKVSILRDKLSKNICPI